MEYRAISLHQPWASLVALGIKKYETRSWSTKFRGRLLICSAKKAYTSDSTIDGLLVSNRTNDICQLSGLGLFHEITLDFLDCHLPLGKVLCVVDLVNCWEMKSYPKHGKYYNSRNEGIVTLHPGREIMIETVPELEQLCGDWQTGRYAWELANLMPLPEPIPIKGKQGLWIPDSTIIQEVEKQLSIG